MLAAPPPPPQEAKGVFCVIVLSLSIFVRKYLVYNVTYVCYLSGGVVKSVFGSSGYGCMWCHK